MHVSQQRRLVIVRGEDHNGAFDAVNKHLISHARRLGIPYTLVTPDRIEHFTPGPRGSTRVLPVTSASGVDIGRQIRAFVGGERFDLILNAHGGDGSFDWRSGSPLSYTELFRALPPSVTSVLVNGCNGGSAMPAAASLPDSTRLYTLSSAASVGYGQVMHAVHRLALASTGRLTPEDLFITAVLNAGRLAPVVSYLNATVPPFDPASMSTNPHNVLGHQVAIGGQSGRVLDLSRSLADRSRRGDGYPDAIIERVARLAPTLTAADVRQVAEAVRTGGFADLSLDDSTPNHAYVGNMRSSQEIGIALALEYFRSGELQREQHFEPAAGKESVAEESAGPSRPTLNTHAPGFAH